jgi:uncharacterized protein (DUF427 family)
MTERAVLIPDAEHPIEIKPNPLCVTVCVAGEVVARSRRALTLREAKYPAVQYIPREDVKMSLLERTDRRTYCPYKGECSYFSIPAGGERSVNAVWTYEEPFKAVALIAGYIAFYPDRVDEIGESPTGW